MIRLTLNPQIEPEIHLFNKSTIIIGPESTHADLVLQDVEGASDYLKLIEENGSWQLINQANDPFISINDEPFGKKRLQTGDRIAIHQKAILFEIISPSNLNLPVFEKESSEHSSMNSRCENKEEHAFLQEGDYPSIEHITLPFEHEVEALKEKDWEHTSIEEYILRFEPKKKEYPESAPSPHSATTPLEVDHNQNNTAPPQTEPKKRISLKDDYLKDLDDDQEGVNSSSSHSSNEPSHLYQAWKWILLFIFSILSISGAVGTVIYYSVSDKTEAHETKATLGTADIAMALTHAQLSNAKPHNHNWSDVEFLKSNLQSLLPNTPSFASKLDAQGQFNCCPYSLRIYTNGDLSHFILIAQPAPSVLYWLIPKPIIVLDSHLMELHALKDVRSLNRLLAMSDPLEGLNGNEITSLVKQGNKISLKYLAKESGLPEFSPPENLSSIHEGAENLIYNAPRYYKLSQSIIQKAINLSDSKSSSQEVASLKQEIEAFTWLKPIVLYSIQGRNSALQTKQGLEMLSPSDKILFGYLQFNPQGEIEQAHILNRMDEGMEGAASTIAMNETIPIQQIEHKTATSHPQEENRVEEEIAQPELDPSVDLNHPIYVQLHALVKGREQELKPHAQTLSTLINQDLHSPTPRFPIEFQEAFNHYLTVDAQHTLAIKEALTHLSHQYEEMPADQFLNYMSALNLDHIMQQQSSSSELIQRDENCRQNIEILLTYIESSKTLSELNNYMEMSGAWLNFDYLKDAQELVRYQNILRNALLDQLQFILLEHHPSRSFKVSSEERNQLESILNHERFIKPEEKEFFIEEFEHVKM